MIEPEDLEQLSGLLSADTMMGIIMGEDPPELSNLCTLDSMEDGKNMIVKVIKKLDGILLIDKHLNSRPAVLIGKYEIKSGDIIYVKFIRVQMDIFGREIVLCDNIERLDCIRADTFERSHPKIKEKTSLEVDQLNQQLQTSSIMAKGVQFSSQQQYAHQVPQYTHTSVQQVQSAAQPVQTQPYTHAYQQPQQLQQSQQHTTQIQPAQPQYQNQYSKRIQDIRSLQVGKSANIIANVVRIDTLQQRNTKNGTQNMQTIQLGDATDHIELTLWGEQTLLISSVNIGDQIHIESGYVQEYKGKVSVSLGKFGKLSINPRQSSGTSIIVEVMLTPDGTMYRSIDYMGVNCWEFYVKFQGVVSRVIVINPNLSRSTINPGIRLELFNVKILQSKVAGLLNDIIFSLESKIQT
ncbi:MAG: hypothetical protein INQ03_09345 [Candidatus Heimdallarchaeota archaeon]|nr:hypothetical protein [Candidatus Heimdallarchaeota archaeon]